MRAGRFTGRAAPSIGYAVLSLSLACSSDQDTPNPPGTDGGDRGETRGTAITFTLPATGLPRPLDVPWPSDAFLSDADGTIADGLDWSRVDLGDATAGLAGYGTLDGFSRHGGALFHIEGEAAIDEASLPERGADCAATDSPVAVLDVGGATPERLPCYAGFHDTTRLLTVGPEATVLAAGRTYVVVVTTAVKLADGTPLAPAAEFAAIRDDAEGARKREAMVSFGAAVDEAVAAGIPRERIAAATLFTTQTTHRQLKTIRDAIVDGAHGPVPQLVTEKVPWAVTRFGSTPHDGWTATLDEVLATALKGTDDEDLTGFAGPGEPSDTGIAHDAIGAILTAAMPSPYFLRPWKQSADIDDGTIAHDAEGKAIATEQLVPVTLVLPRSPAPSSGYPVVIFQHQGGGDRSYGVSVANELARAGIACVSIDAPHHGLRDDTAVDVMSNGPGTYRGPDGFADPSAAVLTVIRFLGGLENYLAMRDNAWQAALDLVQLRRLIGNPALDLSLVADQYGGDAPRLDAARVAYVGVSMGGILGTLLAYLEPRESINPLLLDVAGANLLAAMNEGPAFVYQAQILSRFTGLPEEALTEAHHPWATLVQGIADGGDAGSFALDVGAEARAGGGGHDIWMLGAAQDESASRRTSDTLARALGATQITPTLREVTGLAQQASPFTATGERIIAYYELAPADHFHFLTRASPLGTAPPWPREGEPRFVKLDPPVPVRQLIVGVHRAMVHFFQSAWAGAAEISVNGADWPSLAPIADVDDDGYCDAQESGASPTTSATDPTSTPADVTPGCVRDVGFAAGE